MWWDIFGIISYVTTMLSGSNRRIGRNRLWEDQRESTVTPSRKAGVKKGPASKPTEEVVRVRSRKKLGSRTEDVERFSLIIIMTRMVIAIALASATTTAATHTPPISHTLAANSVDVRKKDDILVRWHSHRNEAKKRRRKNNQNQHDGDEKVEIIQKRAPSTRRRAATTEHEK